VRGSILQQVITANAMEEAEKLAEISADVLDRGKSAVVLKEIGDQKALDRTQPIVVHHLWRVGCQKGPTKFVKRLKQVTPTGGLLLKLEASGFLFRAEEYGKPGDIVGQGAEDHSQVAGGNLADAVDVVLRLRGAEGFIDEGATFEGGQ
jgi:hypothetical protein